MFYIGKKLYQSTIYLTVALVASFFSISSCAFLGHPVVAPAHYANQQETLQVHNQFRRQHHAPDLVWDDSLADYAKAYVGKCIFAHSSPPYGENLAMGSPSIRAAVGAWYSEKNLYSYSRPGFSHATGHFTQVIWKSTTKVGCAYAACNGKNGTYGKYWICEYSPAGNVINDGYFQANVLP